MTIHNIIAAANTMQETPVRIIRFADLKQVPWKNGGGITREVAVDRDVDSIRWRLSLADVASDGPFSKFEKLRRILTVTQGQGMELLSATNVLQADLGRPVIFDGGEAITSRLKNGPLRDFNVIHDPKTCHAEVKVWRGRHNLTCSATPARLWVLHSMAGQIALNSDEVLEVGDTALCETGHVDVQMESENCALTVAIDWL